MQHLSSARAAARKGGRGRLLGIDAARAIALLGMMAVHILPAVDETGAVTWYYRIAGGRSSALFAVLAGLGLALASGGSQANSPLRGDRAATLARAGVLTIIGLFLGSLDSGVAVILVHYGFLFVIGALLLSLTARGALILAIVWALVSPVLSHLLRMELSQGPMVPGIDSLLDPVGLVVDVLLTGYYPVLTWTSYLLIGLGVGRLPLGTRRTSWWLLGGGALMAIGSRLVSAWLLDRAPIPTLPVQFFGYPPTDSWWYLAVATPHSGTTFDLLHTAGSAVAVIGLCLLLESLGRWTVSWLAGAGGMTLTLYSAHVVALSTGVGFENRPRLLLIHATVALLVGAAWRAWIGRGPLETIVARVAETARAASLVTAKGD